MLKTLMYHSIKITKNFGAKDLLVTARLSVDLASIVQGYAKFMQLSKSKNVGHPNCNVYLYMFFKEGIGLL